VGTTSIHYLFPPDQINKLPTWRFILHFIAPVEDRERKTKEASDRLRNAEWKIIEFPSGVDNLPFDKRTGTVAVRIQVSDANRKRPNALADYESDVWKVYGNMLPGGFGDLFYEAVDWHEGA